MDRATIEAAWNRVENDPGVETAVKDLLRSTYQEASLLSEREMLKQESLSQSIREDVAKARFNLLSRQVDTAKALLDDLMQEHTYIGEQLKMGGRGEALTSAWSSSSPWDSRRRDRCSTGWSCAGS